MSNLLKKEKGFTLIEIVLVLAIAGLLLVIVFLAVSGAQKSRRDTQRKNDLSRIASQLEAYASNTSGVYPTADANAQTGFTGGFFNTYISSGNFKDPTSGNNYSFNSTWNAAPAVGTVTYRLGTGCDNVAGAGARVYSVNMGLEQGAVCRDNK